MSVLIKGMKMPKSCESCKLLHDVFVHVSEDFDYFCYVTKSLINRSVHNDRLGGRPENCPLVEVPTPPEPLTDKEQRIFLAAMEKEEKVCKQVDEECRDCREPYEDSLVYICREIERKVKAVLW